MAVPVAVGSAGQNEDCPRRRKSNARLTNEAVDQASNVLRARRPCIVEHERAAGTGVDRLFR